MSILREAGGIQHVEISIAKFRSFTENISAWFIKSFWNCLSSGIPSEDNSIKNDSPQLNDKALIQCSMHHFIKMGEVVAENYFGVPCEE
ncbi:hypothetical protein OIU78_028218 [Salix suchowensis]|nr:hypothetical protein OIU78_028218 [Salix suchowensis]